SAEVVLVAPVAHELAARRELHALRGVRDRLLLRPAGGVDAAAELVELLPRNVDLEGTDCRLGGGGRTGHRSSLGRAAPSSSVSRRSPTARSLAPGDSLVGCLVRGHGQ